MEPVVQEIAKRASEGGDMEGYVVFLLILIVWKLVEEVIRFRGIRQYRKVTGDNPGHKEVCKWSKDNHKWLHEIRDDIKDIKGRNK